MFTPDDSQSGDKSNSTLLRSTDREQGQQHEESIPVPVADPPSFINVPSPEDMSCASSVTTHFQDAQLFVPHMYPSLQSLHDSDDVENPTFQPVTQQTKATTNQSVLPSLAEESSPEPSDGHSNPLAENRITKEQEKATKRETSADVTTLSSLESKIQQKIQQNTGQIQDETDGDTGIDPVVQKEHSEVEITRKIPTEDGESVRVLRLGHNKDPGILDGRRNAAASAVISTVDEDKSTLPSQTFQDFPGSQDLPGPGNQPRNPVSAPGAHAVCTPCGTSSQQQMNPSSRAENLNTADDEEEKREDTLPQALAEAQPVAEGDLPIATADGGSKRRYQRSNSTFYLMGGIFCILVISAIVIGAVCGTGHCSQNVYADGSSTIAPTTTRDAVDAPKIEIVLNSLLGKDYFQEVEEGYDDDLTEFMLKTRQQAFDWIVNQDPMQLEYNSPNLVQRFLLVLFYHQTTRHQPWFECNPPSTSQGTTSSNLCYGLDPFEGKPPLHLWGNRWLSQSHECQWAGITCETVQSKEKQVTWLHMYRNQLNGPLPWEITLLPELKQLLLAWNMLTGVLPPGLQFQESSPLYSLNLAWNEFIGTIPARWFENLNEQSGKLATLGISSNRLTGTIPSEVGLFPLKELYLENNTLTGSLPRELFDQTSFQLLNLRNNDLTGILPSEIVLLTNLQVLKLDHTGIGGSLHSEIGLLSQLGWIGVTYTNMQGTIPGELYGLKNLHTFAISNCNFSGTISSSLGQLTKLSTLHLANNQFHGSLPSEIEALTQLDNLLVNGNNELTGTVPVSLCQNYFADEKKLLRFVANCLPNTQTGVAAIQCTCCTSCCDETGVCLAS